MKTSTSSFWTFITFLYKNGRIAAAKSDYPIRRSEVLMRFGIVYKEPRRLFFVKWIRRIPLLYTAIVLRSQLRQKQATARCYDLNSTITYIRIPKAASSSILQIYLKQKRKELETHALTEEEINVLADYFQSSYERPNTSGRLFTVVRDPFRRLVSVYRDFFERADNRFLYDDYLLGIFKKNMSFSDFVRVIKSIPARYRDQHFASQSELLDNYFDSPQLETFKLEQRELLVSFLTKHGMTLPHINKSGDDYDYRTYYDHETAAIAYQLYYDDVAKFNYKQEWKLLCEFLGISEEFAVINS